MPEVLLRRPIAPRIEYYSPAVSTAFAINILLAPDEDATGNAFVAASATSATILGINHKAIVSGDSDYATANRPHPVLVDEDAIWEFTVGTGTADSNDPQGFIDLKDEDEVSVTASARDVVFVTNFISTTIVRGKITLWGWRQPPVIR